MRRRAFLRQTPFKAVSPLLGIAERHALSSYALVRIARRAMGTRFEVALPFGTPQAVLIAEAALEEIERIEQLLTIYREDSEVARLNASAAYHPVTISEELSLIMSACHFLHRITSGAFDVAMGALIRAWGFERRAGKLPSTTALQAALAASGMNNVIFDPAARTIAFRQRGVCLNFGSYGKGYALDLAARILQQFGVRSALLHGGGSSVLAIGQPPNSTQGWPVAIRHPDGSGRLLTVVHLKNQALSTSAATFQHFHHNGVRFGHLLDPRSGWPARGIASATAVCSSAANADALATALYILGANGLHVELPLSLAVLLPEGSEEPIIYRQNRLPSSESPSIKLN